MRGCGGLAIGVLVNVTATTVAAVTAMMPASVASAHIHAAHIRLHGCAAV